MNGKIPDRDTLENYHTNRSGQLKTERTDGIPYQEMADDNKQEATAKGAGKDEVALELMKFIAVSTGYGKGSSSGAGFGSKIGRTPEEQADSLLELFERCRKTVNNV